MITFLLNDQFVRANAPAGLPLTDFIRYEKGLCGTKIGCREGDCGACSVLLGRLSGQGVEYSPVVSCLTPLINVHGKHVVTIEGLNLKERSPVQAALVAENGAQCGFCTPGVVVALTGYLLSRAPADPGKAVAALDGNICRCTGYKSIERAARRIARYKAEQKGEDPVEWLSERGDLPAYFRDIPGRLKEIPLLPGTDEGEAVPLGGGTDLLVQRPDDLLGASFLPLLDLPDLRGIRRTGERCVIGAATTAAGIMRSPLLREYFPRLAADFRLIASTPVRQLGTIGGNLVNASPIGDLAIFFLALDANLTLRGGTGEERRLPLKHFFKDYKKTDLGPGEYVTDLFFTLPGPMQYFSFEKVAKRTHLDIATVNTAMLIGLAGDTIGEVYLAAGGVAPVPLLLEQTGAFLRGQPLTEQTLLKAARLLQTEIAPITDIRGSAGYKHMLLRQLFFAHFLKLFPASISADRLFSKNLVYHAQY